VADLPRNTQTLQSGYKTLYDKYYTQYKTDCENAIFDLAIDDESGFYDSSITSRMLLSVNQNDLQRTPILLERLKISFTSATVDFEETLAKLLLDNQQMLDSEMASVNEEHRKYEVFLKDKTSSFSIINSKTKKINGFNLNISAPTVVNVNPIGKTIVNASMRITSKDFRDVRPSATMSDKNLSFSYDGKNMTLRNLTKNYLQVRSISVYYNNDVSTVQCDIEIAPESYINNLSYETNSLYSSLKAVRDYPDMTVNKAKKHTVSYGYAVKYRIAEANLDNTLYKKSEYKLLDVLAAK